MNNTMEYKGYLGSVEFSEEDALEMCAQQGKEPERAYKGSFNVRISPEIHKQAVVAAMAHNMTLNSFVESSIAQAVHAGA